jgi:hypothetical protein
MKKLFTILIIAGAFFVLIPSITCFASDRLGCLTCHRYPGLVKLEKSGSFKALHIDEAKHLESAHREVDCRQCHMAVNKIPHDGVTEVECTERCHLEDKEKISVTEKSLSVYHKDEKFAITKIDHKSSCRVCHPLYPHSVSHKVRAILNMHTGYLVCEVCHLKTDSQDKLLYEWKKPEAFEYIGEPYGTHKKHKKGDPGKKKSVISKMLRLFSADDDDEDHKHEYLLSRIAVFSVEKGKKKILINTRDTGKAKAYMKKEKNLSQEEKEAELEYFHRDIARKEISVACDGCHSPDGILDFRRLGFNEMQTKDLQYMNIKSLVTKYDEFYLPNLFGQ